MVLRSGRISKLNLAHIDLDEKREADEESDQEVNFCLFVSSRKVVFGTGQHYEPKKNFRHCLF